MGAILMENMRGAIRILAVGIKIAVTGIRSGF